LAAAFEAERARLSADTPEEIDPALVVVFDLAGSVKDFRNAINRIDGLEFLSELLGDQSDPDDDFHMREREAGRTDKRVTHSLYLVMSNTKAIDELLRSMAGRPVRVVRARARQVQDGLPATDSDTSVGR
jgi:hypothetical protein